MPLWEMLSGNVFVASKLALYDSPDWMYNRVNHREAGAKVYIGWRSYVYFVVRNQNARAMNMLYLSG